MKLSKSLMGNTAHPRYDEFAERVKQFEAKYGDDWDDTMIEYDSDFVRLPLNVYNIRPQAREICEPSSNGSAKATSRKW